MEKKEILVGASGASGIPVLVKVLELIRQTDGYRSGLILSDAAKVTLSQESDLTLEELCAKADVVYDNRNIGAGPASGTYPMAGMVIVPCSMKTLAGIHAGYAENLLLRAADVMLKEQRTLVLGVREAPFSPIHLRNMQELSMIPGVRIIPLMMTFYNHPRTIDDMVTHIACKLLAPFGISSPDYRRWTGLDED